MNHRQNRPCSPPPPHGTAGIALRAASAWALALTLSGVCGIAQEAEQHGIERLVAIDAARLLDDADPVVRGEAALIVAPLGEPRATARILQMANDPEPAARQRALIAVAMLPGPVAAQALAARLTTPADRATADGIVAAFALGCVPPEHVGTSITQVLADVRHGSWRRQHDALNALLLGLQRHPERSEIAPLRALLDDSSNRSPELRGMLLHTLLPIDRSLDTKHQLQLLERGDDAERRAVLRFVAGQQVGDDDPWLALLVRTARGDRDAEVRGLALTALARRRHLPALDLAARALRSHDGEECGRAAQAMLAIGGASARGALERHLLGESDPTRKAALLQNYLAPFSQALRDHSAQVAADGSAPMALRVAAAEALAVRDGARAAPMLHDLFHATDDPDLLLRLARAVRHAEDPQPPLDRLIDAPSALLHNQAKWRALLAAGHPEAQREVLAAMAHQPRDPERLAAALASWRSAMVMALPEVPGFQVPAVLRSALP